MKELILFPENFNVFRCGAERKIEIRRETKLTRFPRDQSLSHLYIPHRRLKETAVIGQDFRVTVHCCPLTS